MPQETESTSDSDARKERTSEAPAAPAEHAPAPKKSWARAKSRIRALAKRAVPFLPLVLLLFVLAAPVLDAARSGGERALSGLSSGGVRLTRMHRSELEAVIARRARELATRKLPIAVADQAFELEPAAIGFSVDARASAERVLATGRDGSWLARFLGHWRRFAAPEEVKLVGKLDRVKVASLLEAWESRAIPDRRFLGGIEVKGTDIAALPPRAGRRIAPERAEQALLAALVEPPAARVALPLEGVPAPLPPRAAERAANEARALLAGPVTLFSSDPALSWSLSPLELAPSLRAEPDGETLRLGFSPEVLAVALERVRREIEAEPVNAKFEVDAANLVTIVPSRSGLRVEWPALPAALIAASMSANRTAALPLLHTPEPALRTDRAEALGIRGLVSSFTTRHPCCEKRVANIHRIADMLDGTLVEPGQTASVNALVGPRTLKAGFVPAPSIEEGEMVDSVGGGISQFATTLFNALFHGGYDIVERQPHTYWFPRYPMGHEATLSWPKPDIIFRNDTTAGLLIKTAYTGTSITVRLFGDNGGRKVRAEVSGRNNVLPAPLEILPNPAMPPDEEKVKEPGSVGWSVIVSRILTFPDGTKKEEKRRVTYRPRPRRVEVHPCRVPEGEKGYTGQQCPEPEGVEELDTASVAGTP
jgi:vancomycin resistance protein YoaR